MMRGRTRARTLPGSRFCDARREQCLRVRTSSFDPIERLPHLGHVAQRNRIRVERGKRQGNTSRSDARRRQTKLHAVVFHDHHAHIMTEGCDNYARSGSCDPRYRAKTSKPPDSIEIPMPYASVSDRSRTRSAVVAPRVANGTDASPKANVNVQSM
jgi:hypothetical protein